MAAEQTVNHVKLPNTLQIELGSWGEAARITPTDRHHKGTTMRSLVEVMTFAGIMLVNGCSKDERNVNAPVALSPGALAGRVVSASTGLSIQGAIIRTSPATFQDTTDAYGIFTMLNIPEGSYRVVVQTSTFLPDTANVDVAPGVTSVLGFELMAPFPVGGMLLSLPFNGTVADEGPLHHAVIQRGGTFTTDRKGTASAALFLNGCSEYIDLGTDTSLFPRQGITLAVWVNRTGPQGSTAITRWETAQHATNQRAFDLSLSSADCFSWSISRDGTQPGVVTSKTANGAVLNQTWYFLAGTWDGFRMRLFVNGVARDSMLQTGMAIAPDVRTGIGAVLGRSGDPILAPFLGKIDDVRIYNRALSAEEIFRLYRE